MLQLKMKTSQKVDICFACSEAKTADGQISSSLNYVSAEMRGTTTESQRDFQLRIKIF